MQCENMFKKYNYNNTIKILAVGFISLNILDAIITSLILNKGSISEANPIISKAIENIGIYPAMMLKILIVIPFIFWVYIKSNIKEEKIILGLISDKNLILYSFLIINIMYIFIILNNIFWGVMYLIDL